MKVIKFKSTNVTKSLKGQARALGADAADNRELARYVAAKSPFCVTDLLDEICRRGSEARNRPAGPV